MARGKMASSIDLPLPTALPDAGNRSKSDCITSAIRDAITKGLIPAESSLPSTRTLADRWKVSRGTVEGAFDRLCSEGYITRTQGSGTRVSATVPDSFLPSSVVPRFAEEELDPASVDHVPDVVEQSPVQAGVPFVARVAAADLLQTSQWARHAMEAARSEEARESGSAPAKGVDNLRQQIAAYLRAFRGISCRAEDIFITSGIRHSIDAIARLLLSRDSKVVVEDPGYPGARRIFDLAAASVIAVPVDEDGLRVDSLDELEGVSLVYVTPAHQSPLGVTLSVDRRRKLLEWSRTNEAWIIEDDYGGEFSYQVAPLPALKSEDRYERVIYCSSFNKTMSAELRVGFMVVPPALHIRMLALWRMTGGLVSKTVQNALATFMASGDFSNHLRRARQAYQQRRDAVLRELDHHDAHERFRVSGSHAGFHFVVWLAPGTDVKLIVERAASVGIALQSLESLCDAASFGPAIVLGFSALSLTQARLFGKKLRLLLLASEDS